MGNKFSENFDYINKPRYGGAGLNYCILKYSPWIFFKDDINDDFIYGLKDKDEKLQCLYEAYKEYQPILIDALINEHEFGKWNESSRQEEDNWTSTENDLRDSNLTQYTERNANNISNDSIRPIFIDVYRIRCTISIEEFLGRGILSNWLKKANQVITYGFSIF